MFGAGIHFRQRLRLRGGADGLAAPGVLARESCSFTLEIAGRAILRGGVVQSSFPVSPAMGRRSMMESTLELYCAECGHVSVLDAREQAAILAELTMPAHVKIIDARAGATSGD
jgi:hypothetical protein